MVKTIPCLATHPCIDHIREYTSRVLVSNHLPRGEAHLGSGGTLFYIPFSMILGISWEDTTKTSVRSSSVSDLFKTKTQIIVCYSNHKYTCIKSLDTDIKKVWKLGSAYRRLLCVPYIDELCGCSSKQKMQKYKRFLSLKLLISEQGIDYLTF